MTNVDDPSLAINVAGFERQHLGDAQTGPVGGHDDHAADERLDFPEQSLDPVTADHSRQLLRNTRPGNIFHLRGTFQRDGVQEAQARHIHLDAGRALASLVKHQ